MSGGETGDAGASSATAMTGIAAEPRGPPTESEEIQLRLEREGEGEEDVEEEGLKVRGTAETKVEAVVEKAGKAER